MKTWWRQPSGPENRRVRRVRPGRLEVPAETHRNVSAETRRRFGAGGALERSGGWGLQLPPPAA